ncbi:MAG: histidine kinase [Sphingobacteriaceae bacterium]|nr:histidine kinase [Cytophagaceae bacterium]
MRGFWFGWLLVALVLPGLGGGNATAQPPAVFSAALPPSGFIDLHPNVGVFEDSSGRSRPLAEVRRESFVAFESQNRLSKPKVNSLKVLWFRFRLRNVHPSDTLRAVLYTGRHTFVTVMEEIQPGRPRQTASGGYWAGNQPNGPALDRYGLPLALPPGQTRLYWVRGSDYFRSFDRFRVELYSLPAYQLFMAEKTRQATPALIFFSAVLGSVLFVSLFSLAQALLTRDRAYAWYAAYLAGTLLWLWRSADMSLDLTPPLPNPKLFFALTLVLGYGIQLAYLHFLGSLLQVPRQQPRLWRWLRGYLGFVTLLMLVSLAEIAVGGFWRGGFLFYTVVSVLNYGALLLFLGLLFRNRHPLRHYAITGSLFLLAGVITTVYLNRSGFQTSSSLTRTPSTYFALGTLLEMLCFSLALGRRSFLHEAEKQAVQRQLIGQLEENQRLQQSHTVELERQLEARTEEVLEQAHRLEAQHLRQVEQGFEQKLAETEMTALRAQMNPHFIFNCLNSIKLYTLENDSATASEFLTKFSRLIRLVLENSRSERVTLATELDALRLYIELEAMRFKNKLTYSVTVAEAIDAQYVEIPPLLLQPYVENAIWHGLMHRPGGGQIHVGVEQPGEDCLRITITDNGIGRTAAGALKSKSATRHKSFGMQVTGERIGLINQLYRSQTQVKIYDLVDAEGQPAGTEVILQIPV